MFCMLLERPIAIWLEVGRGGYGETTVVPVGSASASATATAMPIAS